MSGSNKRKTAVETPSETHAAKKRTVAECSDKYFVVIIHGIYNKKKKYAWCVLRKSGVSKSVWKDLKDMALESLPEFDSAQRMRVIDESDENYHYLDEFPELRAAIDAVFAKVAEEVKIMCEEDDAFFAKVGKIQNEKSNPDTAVCDEPYINSLATCKLAGIVYVWSCEIKI